MRSKSASAHKGTTYGEITRHKEQIQSVLKILKTCVDPSLEQQEVRQKGQSFV